MNVPRTAAQQVPPATVGVGGTLPFGYHTSGCRDWYSVHQTGGASPTNCRHLCLPTPRPSSSSRGVLLTVTQQDTVGDQGTATAPVHAGFPIALSLSPSSSFPSRTLCWFVHTRIHTAWSSRQSAAGIAMPAPIVTVTQPHGHFVPLRPCWKLEQGISEINST